MGGIIMLKYVIKSDLSGFTKFWTISMFVISQMLMCSEDAK